MKINSALSMAAMAAVLLLLGTMFAAAASAQIVIPMGAAATAPSQVTAEAIPSAPTNLQAFTVSADQINLTWQDNSVDETEFRLEIRTGSGTFQDVGTSIPANVEGAQVHGLAPSTAYTFRIRAHNASGYSSYSNEATATTSPSTSTCVPSATAMCLNQNRFRVQAAYRTGSGLSGQAQAVKLTSDSGYLWFFNPDNIEVVVKVLNGCGVNAHYWVFAGGLTNVEVQLIVTDTQTGLQKRYTNPLNTAFQPIQDTNALATCP
jgi:fibronectin type III domain protein